MLDKNILGTIKFTPVPGTNKSRVNFDMPIQIKNTTAGIEIIVPLLGGLTTFAKDHDDIRNALQSVTEAFFHFANNGGEGVRKELEKLGWKGTKASIRFKVSDRDRRPQFNHIQKLSHNKKFSINV